MATIEFDGLEEVVKDLDNSIPLVRQAIRTAVRMGGIHIAQQTRRVGESMGVWLTGQTLNSIVPRDVKETAFSTSVLVTPEGRNKKGERNATVAFVNEYGTRRQAARPFMRKAADDSIDRCEKFVLDELSQLEVFD